MFDLCVIVMLAWLCFGVFNMIVFIVPVTKPLMIYLISFFHLCLIHCRNSGRLNYQPTLAREHQLIYQNRILNVVTHKLNIAKFFLSKGALSGVLYSLLILCSYYILLYYYTYMAPSPINIAESYYYYQGKFQI